MVMNKFAPFTLQILVFILISFAGVIHHVVLVGVSSDSDALERNDKSLALEIQRALALGPEQRHLSASNASPSKNLDFQSADSDSNLAHDILRVFHSSRSEQDPAVRSLLLSAKQAAEKITESDSATLHQSDDRRNLILRIRDFFSQKNHQSPSNDVKDRDRKESVRLERRRYHHLMQEAEQDLSDGYPHQARNDLRRALKRHEEEQRLKGFYGSSVYAKPKALKLLEKTVADDLKDHIESHRVEREMDQAIKVREDVESAKHRYEEDKKLVARAQKAGLHGMFRLSTREGGLQAEQALAKRLDKSYTVQERAWLRAQALEAAKLRAAQEAAPLACARSPSHVASSAAASPIQATC